MTARPLSQLAACLLALVAVMPARSAAGEGIRAVVELFTSQGCSSCPPADALLAELASRPGILALSEHVDYWDYLGWKDPFASHETTERQRTYARAFKLRYVYTPQVVVNGGVQMAGTDRGDILAAIDGQRRPLPLTVTIDTAGGSPAANVGGPTAAAPRVTANVWLFVIEGRARTAVARGENGGRTLENVNVIREVRHIGKWEGAMARYAFSPPDRRELACAVVVQETGGGVILGGAHRDRCID